MRKWIGFLAVAWLGCRVMASPTIGDLKVTAIPPWGVALDYMVNGAAAKDAELPLIVTATDGEKVYSARNLVGATGCVNGAHRVYWNMAADGLTSIVTNGSVTVGYRGLYCVIDLAGGVNAATYPVSYLADEPTGGWTDEYKTTKLVLRYCPAGVDPLRRYRLTKDFYAGVFEVTEKQWELVMGANPSNPMCGETYPVVDVSYDNIRGASQGAKWPMSSAVDAGSFLGRLRTKTGLEALDLPTEAQWEYACRAGTATEYYTGDSEADLVAAGWYNGNSGGGSHPVGEKIPNGWGLYDMHGNVWEKCLDWTDANALSGTDPVGASSGTDRSDRGGCWDHGAESAVSSSRGNYPPYAGNHILGFRVFGAATMTQVPDENWSSIAGVNWSSIADGSGITTSALTLGLAPTAGAVARALADGSEVVRASVPQVSSVSMSVGWHVLTHDDGGMTLSATYLCLGGVVISNVTARQILPWSGLVEIAYDLTENLMPLSHVTNLYTRICGRDGDSGLSFTARTFMRPPTYEKGRHVLVWDAAADGVAIKSSAISFSVAVTDKDEKVEPSYCVVDLSAGPAAARYSVGYLDAMPVDGWPIEYKTTRLVLRRCPAGADPLGRYALTKDFYAGVFEVTEKQWELVMGSNPSQYKRGDAAPVEGVSYDDIRGLSQGAQWPASSAVDVTSFLGKLRAKTGLDFDLPTYAQWEYACRAGAATSKYGTGDSEADLARSGWYMVNADGRKHPVGEKPANAWGLYDMHGNVWEWCLDWGSLDAVSGADPVGAASGSSRVFRGGCWSHDADYATLTFSLSVNPSSRGLDLGFRLFRTLP